jgi:hypothetical protein
VAGNPVDRRHILFGSAGDRSGAGVELAIAAGPRSQNRVEHHASGVRSLPVTMVRELASVFQFRPSRSDPGAMTAAFVDA